MKKRYIALIICIIFLIIPVLFVVNIEALKIYLMFLILSALFIMFSFFILDIQGFVPIRLKKKCKIEEMQYKKRKVFILKPSKNVENKKTILYLHGGSYVIETTYRHWQFLEDLVNDSKMTLILPDYPLTPKYTYKNVFNMIEPLYKKIVKEVGAKNLVLMGDSAGGGMALALLEKLINEKELMPSKTILLSPWLDVTLENPEITKELQKKDPTLIKDALKIAGKAYSGEDGMDNFLVNPILGPIKGLKNIVIFTGTHDILNPDTRKFYKRAQKENVEIDYREVENAIHIWMTYRGKKKEYKSDETFKEIIDLLKKDSENKV